MKKTINDFDLNNKRVIIRCDFNVPMKDGQITDDTRLKASLETINYALDHQAKIILMSHLGRIKTKDDLAKNSLKPVAERLEVLLHHPVTFIPVTKGTIVDESVKAMHSGDIILLENTRYEDLDGNKESGNDPKLGQYWASLGDIYINDAFGTAHRAHASNVGIATYLPSGIGFLIEREIKQLDLALINPKHPFVLILGGSKVSDKIEMINYLIKKVDYLLIGGGMAYTFLKAKGEAVGLSLVDNDNLTFAKEMLNKYPTKIILPVDSVWASNVDSKTAITSSDAPQDLMGLDIGPKTITLFTTYLETAKTIIWNGPMGVIENPTFIEGTKALCEVLKRTDAIKIAGGGDTAGVITNLGYATAMTHISTGGGASLEYMSGKPLPGIAIIKDKE